MKLTKYDFIINNKVNHTCYTKEKRDSYKFILDRLNFKYELREITV